MPPEYADRLAPGANGMFRSTVVSAGEVVGTWKHVGRGANRMVEATPFEVFADDVAEAIPQVYAGLP